MTNLDRALRDWVQANSPIAGAGRADSGAGRAGADVEIATGPSQPLLVSGLKVEASHRRFYRISVPDAQKGLGDNAASSYVVMASPPERENNDQFVALAKLFAAEGIGVPEIIAADHQRGYFLMTDLGTVHLEDLHKAATSEPGQSQRARAMAAAIDTLIRLQQIDDPVIPPYTPERFHDELAIFRDWLLGRWLDQSPPAWLDDVFDFLVDITRQQHQCCVHRDYHCRNLLVSARGIGVVDFQDALMGPASYDLASLLRDCYYTFTEDQVAHWRRYYLEQAPWELDPIDFARQLDLTAIQRQLKAVGIFARLWLRDGKRSHLRYIPPVLRRIVVVGDRYPELAPLSQWLPEICATAENRVKAQG